MLIANGSDSGRCAAGFDLKEMAEAQARQMESTGESEQVIKKRAACDECSKLKLDKSCVVTFVLTDCRL